MGIISANSLLVYDNTQRCGTPEYFLSAKVTPFYANSKLININYSFASGDSSRSRGNEGLTEW